MTEKTLSPEALAVIQRYLHLSLGGQDISCPYYNNRRQGMRGTLRVLVGKGTPADIREEAEMIALRKKIKLSTLDAKLLKQFLVDEHLGVDCSAFAYYILDTEARARGLASLKKTLAFPLIKNPLRRLLARHRSVQNTSTRTLAHPENSTPVDLKDTLPGDLIIFLDTGMEHDRDHVLVIHEASYGVDGQPAVLHYSHSLQWRTDGKYAHGVRQGTIEVTDTHKPILEQRWMEGGKTGADNGTWEHAGQARRVDIRRLNLFS